VSYVNEDALRKVDRTSRMHYFALILILFLLLKMMSEILRTYLL
jgi:hypothetical protein